MDINKILTEARQPSTVQSRINIPIVNRSMRILVEADDDKPKETKSNEPEEKEEKNPSTKKDDEPKEEEPDDSDTKEEDEPSDESENPDDDEDPIGDDDDSSEDLDDEQDDDASNDDNETSSGSVDSDSPKDDLDPDKTKSLALMNDSQTLYYSIKRIISKLNNVTDTSPEVTIAIMKVKDNFIVLSDLLFEFITTRFNTNTYVKNLYTFNYFIQSFKINTDILEKSVSF